MLHPRLWRRPHRSLRVRPHHDVAGGRRGLHALTRHAMGGPAWDTLVFRTELTARVPSAGRRPNADERWRTHPPRANAPRPEIDGASRRCGAALTNHTPLGYSRTQAATSPLRSLRRAICSHVRPRCLCASTLTVHDQRGPRITRSGGVGYLSKRAASNASTPRSCGRNQSESAEKYTFVDHVDAGPLPL